MVHIQLSTNLLRFFLSYDPIPLRKCLGRVEFKFSINGPLPFIPSNVGHYRFDALKPEGPIDNSSKRGIPVGIAYLDTTISSPIHRDTFMNIYFRKIYKFSKTVHKSSSCNSLIYKILHAKSSFFL